MKEYVQENGGVSVAGAQAVWGYKLLPGFSSLFQELKRLKGSALDAFQTATPRDKVAEVAVVEVSPVAAADPDAVSTAKLLVVVASGAAVFGSYRLAQIYLGQEKIDAYVHAVQKKMSTGMDAANAKVDAQVALMRASLTVHITAFCTATSGLAAAAYTKSGVDPILAVAKGKSLEVHEKVRPYALKAKAHAVTVRDVVSVKLAPAVAKYQEVSGVVSVKTEEIKAVVTAKVVESLTLLEAKALKVYGMAAAHARMLVKGVVLKVKVTTGNGLVRAGLSLHMDQEPSLDSLVGNLKDVSKSLEDKYPSLVKEVEELEMRVQEPKNAKTALSIEEKEYEVITSAEK